MHTEPWSRTLCWWYLIILSIVQHYHSKIHVNTYLTAVICKLIFSTSNMISKDPLVYLASCSKLHIHSVFPLLPKYNIFCNSSLDLQSLVFVYLASKKDIRVRSMGGFSEVVMWLFRVRVCLQMCVYMYIITDFQ